MSSVVSGRSSAKSLARAASARQSSTPARKASQEIVRGLVGRGASSATGRPLMVTRSRSPASTRRSTPLTSFRRSRAGMSATLGSVAVLLRVPRQVRAGFVFWEVRWTRGWTTRTLTRTGTELPGLACSRPSLPAGIRGTRSELWWIPWVRRGPNVRRHDAAPPPRQPLSSRPSSEDPRRMSRRLGASDESKSGIVLGVTSADPQSPQGCFMGSNGGTPPVRLVGRGGLEPPTSALSARRSAS